MYYGKPYDDIIDPQEVPFDKVTGESPLAWKLKIGDKEKWFPKSQCGMDKEKKELNGTIYVPLWLAEKNGLV